MTPEGVPEPGDFIIVQFEDARTTEGIVAEVKPAGDGYRYAVYYNAANGQHCVGLPAIGGTIVTVISKPYWEQAAADAIADIREDRETADRLQVWTNAAGVMARAGMAAEGDATEREVTDVYQRAAREETEKAKHAADRQDEARQQELADAERLLIDKFHDACPSGWYDQYSAPAGVDIKAYFAWRAAMREYVATGDAGQLEKMLSQVTFTSPPLASDVTREREGTGRQRTWSPGRVFAAVAAAVVLATVIGILLHSFAR